MDVLRLQDRLGLPRLLRALAAFRDKSESDNAENCELMWERIFSPFLSPLWKNHFLVGYVVICVRMLGQRCRTAHRGWCCFSLFAETRTCLLTCCTVKTTAPTVRRWQPLRQLSELLGACLTLLPSDEADKGPKDSNASATGDVEDVRGLKPDLYVATGGVQGGDEYQWCLERRNVRARQTTCEYMHSCRECR